MDHFGKDFKRKCDANTNLVCITLEGRMDGGQGLERNMQGFKVTIGREMFKVRGMREAIFSTLGTP